jgi:hypothetical protein
VGLESHVNEILTAVGVRDYYWSTGLNIDKEKAAQKIIKILDDSGEFGPTRYNKETKKIEFGVFRYFFSGSLAKYDQYCKDFKNWLVNVEGEKLEGHNG